MDPLSTARYGMMAAERRLSQAATMADPVEATVAASAARVQFAAQAGVVRIADETWRALMAVVEPGRRAAR